MLNGLCILIGGMLLLVPGFLSDIAGLTFLFPPTRALYRAAILRWLERKLRSGSMTIRRW